MNRARLLFLAVLGFTMLAVTRPIDTNGNLWARLSLTFSIVERGALDIGPYLFLAPSPDWAEHQGRYFSNKAPGPALMAVPLYALQHAVQRRIGVAEHSLAAYRIAGWLANALAGVLPTLLALALLWQLFEVRYGFTPRGAFGLAALAGAGSLALPYSTMLFGHQTAAAFLTMGVALTLLEESREAPRPARVWVAGLAFGLAVLADHMAALGVIGWSAWLLLRWRDRPRLLAAWVLGGAGPAALLLAFNHAIFGSPFVSAYSPGKLNTVFAHEVLFHRPSLRKLYEITVGPARGWFYATPVFAFVLGGIALAPRLRRETPELLPAAAVLVAALLVLASWNSWHGGNATGPRYLVWTLPFAMLLLVPVAQRIPRVVAVAGVASAALMLLVTVTEPLLPLYRDTDPFFRSSIPILFGRQGTEMVNAWTFLGAPLPLAFLLFVALWLGAGALILRLLPASPAARET